MYEAKGKPEGKKKPISHFFASLSLATFVVPVIHEQVLPRISSVGTPAANATQTASHSFKEHIMVLSIEGSYWPKFKMPIQYMHFV